jgi:hypothetical protein
MQTKALLLCLAVCTLFSCKRDDPEKPLKPHLSFSMNGTEYTFDVMQFTVASPATGGIFRIRSSTNIGTGQGQPTDFSYWFDIRKTDAEGICAVLMPKKFPIPYIDSIGNCNFAIPTVDLNGNGLDPANVYYYTSGTINYAKSNCGNKSYYGVYCLGTQHADMCDVSGTFTPTFRNGINETITLDAGKLMMPNVRKLFFK